MMSQRFANAGGRCPGPDGLAERPEIITTSMSLSPAEANRALSTRIGKGVGDHVGALQKSPLNGKGWQQRATHVHRDHGRQRLEASAGEGGLRCRGRGFKDWKRVVVQAVGGLQQHQWLRCDLFRGDTRDPGQCATWTAGEQIAVAEQHEGLAARGFIGECD